MIAAIPVLHVPPLLAPLPVTSVRYSMVCASASPDQALINREIAKTIEYLNELDSEALPSLCETIEELQLAKRCLQERTQTGFADGAVRPVASPSPPMVTKTNGAVSAFAASRSPSLIAPIFQPAVLLPKKGTLLVVAAFQKVIRTALTIAVLLGAVMLQIATVLQDAMLQITSDRSLRKAFTSDGEEVYAVVDFITLVDVVSPAMVWATLKSNPTEYEAVQQDVKKARVRRPNSRNS
jgi:hypothetical protein